jgi:hypothetical protein
LFVESDREEEEGEERKTLPRFPISNCSSLYLSLRLLAIHYQAAVFAAWQIRGLKSRLLSLQLGRFVV